MLDSESSLRLNLLRFPLVALIVFLHAYSSTVGFSDREIGVHHSIFIVDFVRNFVSQGVARIAVPVFFLISGYLFFFGFEWSKENYLIKLKSRTKSLLIPFLFWNITTLLINALAQDIPATKIFFSGEHALVATFSVFDYLNAIIGFTRYPISYQFWFIRDLIILVMLAPLVHIINRVSPLSFLGVILICWLTDVWPVYVPSSEALLFFSFGGYLASIRKNLFNLDQFGAVIVVLYLTFVTIDILTRNLTFNPYLHKIAILLGVSAALFSTKYIAQNERLQSLILRLSGASFFVFAIHEPLLTILRKISYRIISPSSPSAIIALYIVIPTITILFAVVAYRGFVRVAPRFASVVTGGR